MDTEEQSKICKVVLVGESGVGKTSIITRYVCDTVDDYVLSTLGASYVSKTMKFQDYNNQSLTYEIWDTAGQERFRALTRIFYKEAAIAILVYSVPQPETFKEIQEYWYNQIKEYASKNIIISIAGNKSDIISDEEVDETEARIFAKEIGAFFRLTSAKTGLGVDDLFKCVGSRFIDPEYVDEEANKRKSIHIKKGQIIKSSAAKKCC